MLEQISGAELALLHLSATVMGETRLDSSVRIEGGGGACSLREAAVLLEGTAAPVDLHGARDGLTLVVRHAPSAVDRASHTRWIAALVGANQKAFGVAGEAGELLVIGDPFAPPVGEARWSDLEAWNSRYLGDAWGGGLGPTLYNFDPPIGVGCAAVISLHTTGGGRASGRAADRDHPPNDR